MTNDISGQLQYEEGFGWRGKTTLLFGGRQYGIPIMIQVYEDEDTNVTDAQRNAFARFMGKWDAIEPELAKALIDYYNNVEKYGYGPENEEEAALWWPDKNTYEELVNTVTPEMIVIPPDPILDEQRRVFLLFDRAWGGEDLDDNGIGVCFLNERIAESAYKDIAF